MERDVMGPPELGAPKHVPALPNG